MTARGWTAVEYVHRGISGAKDRRPALDQFLADAKRRRFDAVVVWRLDRLGRNLRHLITLLEELQSVGIAFVSLNEGIDATTPAGKLQMHILGAIAEFERARIAERVQGRLATCQGARNAFGSASGAGARRTAPGTRGVERAGRGTGPRRLAIDRTTLARFPPHDAGDQIES